MSKIPGSAHLNLTLGGLVMAGGAVGYMKKGSKASLLAGMAFGSMFLGAGYAIAKTDYVNEGHVLATTASGVLKTYKFMPARLVVAMGAGACAYNNTKAVEWAPSK
jgi:uncharacterized membrane protein (UPF0136 family)